MGSEGKSRKRRASPSPSPSREEDGKGRKHRKRDGGERRRSRDDDEDGDRKKKKTTKSSERSHKEKKPKEKHVKHRKKDSADSAFKELSEDDYFAKNNEFSTWLKEEKGVYFSDLSSEQARDQFSSFIKDWNKHKLESRYYEGIATGPRTSHNWKIRKDK